MQYVCHKVWHMINLVKKICLVARTLIGSHVFQYGTKHFCGPSEKSNFINVSYIFIYLEYIIRECLNIFQI